MQSPAPPASSSPLQGQISRTLHGASVLALLYFGREVLVPITLALILSLLIAPLVRALRRIGLGQAPSVLGAVVTLTTFLVGLAVVIGLQVANMASSLPQYEATIRSKIQVVQSLTVGRMETMRGEAGRIMSRLADQSTGGAGELVSPVDGAASAPGAVPVEIRERPSSPARLISQISSAVWGPLGEAGIVLVVLVFVLLEHESLRDRFIRLFGGSDLQNTTHAFNDAGERLSRFFVSQFAVNCGVGAAVGVGLFCIGLPHAVFWAVLTAVLRFIPYIGVAAAAVSASLLAAAVDPGWSILLMTLGLFAIVEIVASQAVEPQLYGHSTGLSPLSVVIAAIFWSWIWGPPGLLLSTPLTLCLVVAGRHVEALAFLDVLLGDAPALTMSQRFYQRALSGDADEIIAAARTFLKRKTFAKYCDSIVMPALRLGSADLDAGRIAPEQQRMLKGAVAHVLEALGSEGRTRTRWHRRISVLDEPNLGLHLRHRREDVTGKWQGPIAAPPSSVVLCIGLGSVRDELITEILVRVLRDRDIDARHLSVSDLGTELPAEASAQSIALLFLVSTKPTQEWEQASAVTAGLRRRFPQAGLIGMLPSGFQIEGDKFPIDGDVVQFAHSFEEALRLAAERFPGASE